MRRLRTFFTIAAASAIMIGAVYVVLPASFYTLTVLVLLISVFLCLRVALFR